MKRKTSLLIAGTGAVLWMGASAGAAPVSVTVSIENLAPIGGTALTPFWAGFHDGSFDLYNSGEAASLGIERIAEDGNSGPLSMAFMGANPGFVDGTIVSDQGIPPILPGETATMSFMVDNMSELNRYFSYAAMVLPSNDAFVANGNPMEHALFNAMGEFIGENFYIAGSDVLDAGTEVNDELAENTAFFGQSMPNTGVDEGGVVGAHAGFNPVGSGGILDSPEFVNADFTVADYPVAFVSFSVASVPSPGAVGLIGLAGLAAVRRRR
ncbi:MAG: spondin domain-containing protein [Phycisphaerales bacterium JB050]